ncbi:hypothetical protein DNTS_034199 [Danionella cerebrum]|uniref:NADP-dependent oxidoreductase domain-containing protein 1 n=1 Tax=Danionella cerebrum TaxID=2873325 RepID=A0A553MYX4_9TELE|nr:hypothetical protein DNTS_034199 [Danionella translucida]
MDLTVNLPSLEFMAGLGQEEKELLFLRSRSAGLYICGCAHAVFVYKLFSLLRTNLSEESNSSSKPHLSVGILGGGHLGKQLAKVLLHSAKIRPRDMNVSTKRPETLGEISSLGVECYCDNLRLAKWADLLFLCVLPTDLPQVCSDLRCHLPPGCLLYAFTCATALNRLAMLLDHSFIIKPQYGFVACEEETVWSCHHRVMDALKDKAVISASNPFSMKGGLFLNNAWVPSVIYALLNICTTEKLSSQNSLRLLNELFHSKMFTNHSFVTSPNASQPDNCFPWISLVEVQSTQTPLSDLLSRNEALRDCISILYCNVLSTLENE